MNAPSSSSGRICGSVLALLLCVGLSYTAEADPLTDSQTVIRAARERLQVGAYSESMSLLQGLHGPLPMATQRQIDLIQAEALMGQGKFEAALVAARQAVAETAELSDGDRSDGLLLLARVEALQSPALSPDKTFEQALALASRADGPNSLRALRVKDRMALVLSATKAAEAEAIIKDVISQVARLQGDTRRDLFRFENTLGISLLRQSQFERALTAFDAAKEGRLILLSERHPEYLESLHNYGVAQRRLKQMKEADEAFQKALSLRLDVLGPTHPDTLVTRMMIVRQLIDKSAYEMAVTEATALTDALMATRGERDIRTIQALSDLGDAQFKAGRVSEGGTTYKRAYRLAIETLTEEAPEAMNIGHQYASLLAQVGQYGEALGILQRILITTRKIFDDENRDTLATLHSIAVIMADIGRTEDAIAVYKYILATLNKQVSPVNPERLSVLNNLSTAQLAIGHLDEALNGINEVVRLRTVSLGPNHSLTLLSRSNRGAVLTAFRRYPEAIAEHREVYALRKQIRGAGHLETLKSLHNLAAALSDHAEFPEARNLFEQVVTARVKVLGSDNADTVSSMRGLASLLIKTGNTDNAKALLVKILQAAESMRSNGGLSDSLRRSYFATVTPAYKDFAIIEAQEGNFESALKVSQLSKARTLIETSAGRGIARNMLVPSERSQLSDLEFRIAALDRQIPNVPDVATRSDLEAQRSALATRFRELNSALQTKYPAYREAVEPCLLRIADLNTLLDNNTALLDVIHSDRGTIVVWYTGSDRYGVVALPDNPNLDATVEAYRAAVASLTGISGLRYPPLGTARKVVWKLPDGSYRLQAVDSGPIEKATIVPDIEEIRTALSSWFLSRLPAEVQSAQRWVIIPDGPLALLPIETLKSGKQWMVEAHDISYSQSASMLRLAKDRLTEYAALPRDPLLAIGNPAYSRALTLPTAVQPRPIDALRGSTNGGPGKAIWRDLPGAAAELSALASLFELQSGINLFTEHNASVANVLQLQKQNQLGRYKYVVFSTHGYLDSKHPDLSGIVLSQIDLRPEEDGYLRAPQLASLDFRSDFVFLSACDSGVGRWVSGEGILGLPFALYAGGNAGAVLTLWPVVDTSTAEFVKRFFMKVKDGVGPLHALSETKREFLRGDRDEGMKAPAIWGPFMYYGW